MGVPMVIYKGSPKPHSWCRWMSARTMRKNNSNLVVVPGMTGSGKTWSAISICETMSKMSGVPFPIDNIVFSLTELMMLINSGKLKRGSCIIFDEPQASISSKDFQSKANKVFNLLVTTFRHRNYSLFFCTPFENLLDKSTRRLFHCKFETMSINPNEKTCRLKPRQIEYSDYNSKIYRKMMLVRFKDKNGLNRSEKLSYWDVPKPSDDMVELYEAKKLEFTTNLNKNIMKSLEEFDNSGKSMTSDSERDRRKPLTDRQEEVMKVLANHTFTEAVDILDSSLGTLHEHKKQGMKKGYTLEEFKNEQ